MTELTTFWHFWVTAIVIGTMISCGILLTITTRGQKYDEETDQTTGHSFDGIEELDNPLPSWWKWFFWSTIIYGFGYLLVYGVGGWTGFSDWSSHEQWDNEVAQAEEKYAPYYAKLNAMTVEELAVNDEALATGQRIYASNCSV
jgi:cytochrome c oxidase cbb3-type subunit 3